MLRSLFVILFAISILGCNKDENQRETDKMLIEEYISENNLDAQSTASGLYYVIDEPGNEEHPNLQHDVTIHYEGKLLDGTKFDSSLDRGEPSTFALADLIEGWQEGIPLFGKGGNGKLLIPSHLGYGSNTLPGIPANSVLLFDIELIDFQ
jgi:FKBP-type peptidyl-prolyl cis-trans isomerase FkpA